MDWNKEIRVSPLYALSLSMLHFVFTSLVSVFCPLLFFFVTSRILSYLLTYILFALPSHSQYIFLSPSPCILLLTIVHTHLHHQSHILLQSKVRWMSEYLDNDHVFKFLRHTAYNVRTLSLCLCLLRGKPIKATGMFAKLKLPCPLCYCNPRRRMKSPRWAADNKWMSESHLGTKTSFHQLGRHHSDLVLRLVKPLWFSSHALKSTLI